MAFLQLKNIGKIYVSEGAVAVGIRNVNLSFERGEFVAITGASGSGKSTLLNVISGMDTYEEGELFIEGNPTSHYLQSDWEEYREKYISFIFQDYNIIESFTVLQNVELSLMNIKNPIERRRRAIELLKRVGLEKFLRQKGSRLSGGQKQRCVIARALAKDSPVILADEPTGNLDAQSSKEIVELLKEVSRDKLLIVVTHNFEEVESCASRHIRVFDGAIESDRVIAENAAESLSAGSGIMSSGIYETADAGDVLGNMKKQAKPLSTDLRNGLQLGWASFTAKPKLTAFLCFILMIGTLGAAVISSLLGDVFGLFDKFYMFTPVKGRVIISNREVKDFSEEELEKLKKDFGAESYVRYDAILDADIVEEIDFEITYHRFGSDRLDWVTLGIGASDKKVGSPYIGHYPKDDDEALLYVPLAYKNYFTKEGKINSDISTFSVGTELFDIVGVKYYIDNTKTAKLILTDEGYERVAKYVSNNWKTVRRMQKQDVGALFGTIDMISDLMRPDDKVYNQASLIFSSNHAAKKAAKELTEAGYLACTSKTTYHPDVLDLVLRLLAGGLSFLMWIAAIFFLTFFVNLCTHRSLDVIKGDLTIFRSMGISVRVIKISLFMRMYLSLIPAFLLNVILAFLVYLSPNYNSMFHFLHFRDYAIIVIGIIVITTLVTRKQIHRLFEESVKKTLKGGAEA